MAEPGNRHSQQAVRRPYDSSAPAFSHQAPFYHPTYTYHYPAYPNHLGASQYHQPLPTQQWSYYNSNYYPRSPPPLPAYGQYGYPMPGSVPASFVPRTPAPVPQNYSENLRLRQDSLIHQAALNAVSHPAATSHQVPPTPPLETGMSQPPTLAMAFSGHKAPYYPPLPWLSVPERSFPPKHRRHKRRLRAQSASQPVELPIRASTPSAEREISTEKTSTQDIYAIAVNAVSHTTHQGRTKETTDHDQDQKSQMESIEEALYKITDDPKPLSGFPAKSGVAVPVLTNLATSKTIATDAARAGALEQPNFSETTLKRDVLEEQNLRERQDQSNENQTKAPPKSWAELLKVPIGSRADGGTPSIPALANSANLLQHKPNMMGQAIAKFSINMPHKLSFLEPRGLINSGNMCYMNSILQALMFCVPFYNFLSHISRHAAYSFHSETPLLDAMIMFAREFSVIDSADSVEKLRLRLKPLELEQFGDSLLPEYVYEAIRRMPRFATMQRGHQQDAEEFLGFLLEELQEECAKAIRMTGVAFLEDQANIPSTSLNKEDDGWYEVGPRQKAAATRSSGLVDIDTPINHIFGGKLRSELRIPGAKNSVTLEPYQSLQLDIGSTDIKTIVDALKGLTRPETLHGDFHSPRGTGATATKQVFIEELPSVLILHLKRFQYDNTGGTQKIWKSIGYPLNLEIPRELFPHSKRAAMAMHGGLPKYRLFSVVYHHGKSATVGHYTTDLLRQDNKEWLRIDDTMIRRVRNHEVEAGEEESSRVLAAALELHRDDVARSSTFMENSAREGLDTVPEKGWSQARGSGKKWSGVVNGTAMSSGRGTPTGTHSTKDSKVAYILFYEKVAG